MTDTISWISTIIFLVILICLVGLAASRKYQGLPDEDVEHTPLQDSKTIAHIDNATLQQIKRVDSKKGYRRHKPGKRGCSAVSQAILEDYGAILSRSTRRNLTKL